MLRWRHPLPLTELLQGVYIDDGLIAGIVLKSAKLAPGADSSLSHKALQSLRDAKLEIADDKGFGACQGGDFVDRRTRYGSERFTIWGTTVDGHTGDVGADPGKRLAVAMLLFDLVRLPRVEKNILERGLALLPHPMAHRRELMSLLHRSYRWSSSLAYGQATPWAPDVRAELLLAAVSLFVADSNIRWAVSPRVTATDATPTRGGSVSALVQPSLAQALWTSAEQRGRATTLRREIVDPDSLVEAPEIAEVARCVPWQTERNRTFCESQHVNLQELLEIVDEMNDAARRSVLPMRTINMTDSLVSLCGIAKGRSSSHLLNGLLRKYTARSVAGNKAGSNTKVSTHDNVADDASRDKPLREPDEPSSWLAPLLRPWEFSDAGRHRPHAHIPPEFRAFREAFAGCCRLSASVLDENIPVARPLEAFPSHDNSRKGVKYISANDLDDPAVRQQLHDEIACGMYFWMHFGIPCTGWASLNMVNGGSRSKANPEGNGILEREVKANRQAIYVAELCLALHAAGCFFSIENPVPSHLWICGAFEKLMCSLDQNLYIVNFDQCAFKLQLPGCLPHECCKKATRVWTNMKELCRLEARCPGTSVLHQHVHATGSVVIDGIRHSRAAAAGRYPLELCKAFAAGGRDARKRVVQQAPQQRRQ